MRKVILILIIIALAWFILKACKCMDTDKLFKVENIQEKALQNADK